ncbi:uncharacterized protein [Clytia hemisphaerica]|uniref:TRAPPC10/Trs130 N-terminal domain-containing protein n=1 Tax=Clytia hemisphaerica TaxID=252671 RepID=A0A7M5X0X4_9CNID
MDFKAVISNHGNEKVFKELSGEIERRLPSAPVEWKRSYGRASKEVVLQASFSKFDLAKLSPNSNIESFSKLATKPLLHLFWISCNDNDKYKSSIKSEVNNWKNHLATNKNVDWLIVHVMYQENAKSGKSKIQLPRSSVFDKLKSDFGQDRCVQLWEPDKETLFTKSNESWQTLLSALRNSLLESFGRYLDKFEEKIRSMREKYADPKWPFIEYFLVHEELAFIYQSITLNDDALIQYDEVDALLSQFIINSSGKEFPKWLTELSTTPTIWDGVILSGKVADQYNTLIKSNKATLLDLRNYIFLRQCKLLIKMKRKWEIPSRLLEFLFAVIHEFRLLDMKVPDHIVACWIVLTCLQVLPVLEKDENLDHSFRATVAQTYDLMRQKILLLGQVTGVYYNREQSDEEKELVQQLYNGLGKFSMNKNHSPKVVEAALESRGNFEKLYIDITNACMTRYEDIGRKHSKMFVGIDLAKYYLQHGQYLLAEPLLETSWSIYKSQRWETLYTDVLIPLADCQLKHKLHERYLSSVTLLSCAHCLPFETRDFYSKEVMRLSNDKDLNLPTINSEPVLKIISAKVGLVKHKGHIGDTVQVNIIFDNELTMPVECQRVTINAKHFDLSNPDSFSENVLSARKSLFENKDFGMNSISPQEKQPQKEETAKEALTPSNLLKRIKSHRRTWSRNKNVVETNEIKTDSITISIDGSTLNATVENDADSAKRALFKSESEAEPTSQNSEKTETANKERAHSEPSNKEPPQSETTNKVRAQSETTNKGRVQNEEKSEHDSKQPNGDIPKRSSLLEIANETNTDLENPQPSSNEQVDTVKSEATPKEQDLSLDLSQLNIDETSTPNRTLAEETSVNLDVVLETKGSQRLQPGRNNIQVMSIINHEGKYNMQCVNCHIGNLHFYKKLTSRKDASFYMVTEPPRVTWTTNYLVDYSLTGSKQRIHVTLMNGPGVIQDGSLLLILSKTGLLFYDLSPSDIEIFPLEREGKARTDSISIAVDDQKENALLRLPLCKPYERVNVFFDVMAPMHQDFGQQSTYQHEINFHCKWLEHLVPDTLQQLTMIFYEPFQLKHEVVVTSTLALLKVSICGVNPVHLVFSSPNLVIAGNSLPALNDGQDVSKIYNSEETAYLWSLNLDELKDCITDDGQLDCFFNIDFKTKETHEAVPEHFERKISISLTKCLFSVDVSIKTEKPKKGETCSVSITIKLLGNRPQFCEEDSTKHLCLKIDPSEHFWRLATESSMDDVLRPEFSDDVTEWSRDIDLVCDAVGLVNVPLFALCYVDNVEKNGKSISTELVSMINQSQVDYLSAGRFVFVEELSLETDV